MEPSPFTAWENFYVIVGGGAAALTGLQFVVVVLGAELRTIASEHTTSAFGTPNIVHFGAALLNSALLSAPWKRVTSAAVAVTLFAAAGLLVTLNVLRHAGRQRDYVPVAEDWIWHVILPVVSYATLMASGLLMPGAPGPALFGVGGASLLLLFIGIHNAWDAVIYHVFVKRRSHGGHGPPR